MESLPYLIVFTIVFVILAATLVSTLLLTTKALRQSNQQQMEATRELSLQQMSTLREFLEKQTQASLDSMKETTATSTSSLSSALSDVTTALREAQTLLASKDPIAYRMLAGAQAAAARATDDSTTLYSDDRPAPTQDDVQNRRLVQAFLESSGVTSDVDYSHLPPGFPAVFDEAAQQ